MQNKNIVELIEMINNFMLESVEDKKKSFVFDNEYRRGFEDAVKISIEYNNIIIKNLKENE